MAASTPTFKGISPELRDNIFIMYFRSLDKSPLRTINETVKLFLAFPEFHHSIKVAISLTNAHGKLRCNHVVVKDFQFASLLECFNSDYAFLKVSDFVIAPPLPPCTQSRSPSILMIDLVFGNNSDWDIQDLQDALYFFQEHKIIPLYSIKVPNHVKASAHSELKAQAELLDNLAGFPLFQCLSYKLGVAAAGMGPSHKGRKAACLLGLSWRFQNMN